MEKDPSLHSTSVALSTDVQEPQKEIPTSDMEKDPSLHSTSVADRQLSTDVQKPQTEIPTSDMEKDPSLHSISVADRQPSADGQKPQKEIPTPDASCQEDVGGQEMSYEESQYVTGFKLAIIMISLTIVFFLVMLDLSIIATVSKHWCAASFASGYR